MYPELLSASVSCRRDKLRIALSLLFIFTGLLFLKAQAPVVTTAASTVPEGTPFITLAATNSPTSWNLVGGEDQNVFTIDNTGKLTFKSVPDYDRPLDVFADNTYKIIVTASNASGTSAQKPITITITNLNENPDPPRSLFVVSQNKSNILRWTSSIGGGVTQYRVYRSVDSLSWTNIAFVNSPDTFYTDNSLINGKFYFYRVKAWNGAAESVFSNTDASTPFEPPIAQYMHFDGNGDYMVVSNPNKLMSFPYDKSSTIECWFRFSILPVAKVTILSQDYDGNSSLPIVAPFRFHEIYYENDSIRYRINGGFLNNAVANIITVAVPARMQANTWYHLAAVYSYKAGGTNDDYLKLYLNGNFQKSAVATSYNSRESFNNGSFFPLSSRLVIGATTASVLPSFSYNSYFNGDISEVRLWSTELDQPTIAHNMRTRLKGDTANMNGLWHLDAMYHRQVYDYDNLNFNAIVYGDASLVASKKIAVDDFMRVSENSVNNNLNIRKNDTITDLKTNVVTKILPGYPKHGSLINPTVVLNKDSIRYSPEAGFVGIDSIKYLICDTTFFNNPYQFSDTAVVLFNVRCNKRSAFDWTTHNNENPDGKRYIEDGLFMKFKLYDPANIISANGFKVNNRFQSLNSIIWQQSPANNSDVSIATVSFTQPVGQICFNFLNLDYTGKNKDSLIIDPYFGGHKLTLNAGEYTLSPALTFKGNNTFVGNASVGNPSTDGNTEVCFLPVVDSIRISYGNSSNPTGNNQSIGIGNFNWCEVPNHNPEFLNSSGVHITTSLDSSYEDKPDTIRLKFRDVDMDLTTITSVTAKHGTILGISMADSSFRYQGFPNQNGRDTIMVIIKDDRSPQLSDTLRISMYIRPINDAPSFTKGPNQTINEDAPAQTVSNWATAISKGPVNENAQTLTFTVTNNNNSLFSIQPAIDASGNLTYTPAANANGAAIVNVVLKDNGGTIYGGVDSTTHQTFTITINAVNDAPSFTKGANQTVLEDAGAQLVNNWATAISKGPANENGQILAFTATNNNNGLFSSQPSIDTIGNLRYTPAANANGIATVNVVLKDNGGKANGGIDSTIHQTFTITVTAVNDVPSFTIGTSPTILEDAGPQSITGWATAINDGDPELTQTLAFNVTNDNNALFSTQPAIDPTTGSLIYTPAANANGTANVTVTLSDDGLGVAPDTNTSAAQTFTITVSAVNDAPVFTKGGNQALNESAGAQTVSGWATAIDDGDPELTQILTFHTSNDNNALFSTQPTIDATKGDLTYTPAANANGTATVTVTLSDDGSNVAPNINTSATQTFTITISAINNAPIFTKGADQSISEDAGAQIVPAWASAIDDGDPDQVQTLTFNVTSDNTALFSVQPSIDASTGNLSYTPAANANGMAMVTVTLSDNGSGVAPNVNTCDAQTFTIAIGEVNDAPSFIKGADQTILEDAGAQNINGWATTISRGPANENSQNLTFIVTNNNNDLFASQPSIDTNGSLTYTPATNANGFATVDVVLKDDGGTANNGVDSSLHQTFTITITSVNDAPSFSKGTNQSVPDNSGEHTVTGWASLINKGAANEDSQTLTFTVHNNNNSLFSVQPTVDADGNLTYTVADNANSIATLDVVLKDNGGTANGGVDSSAHYTFTITVLFVNDPPTDITLSNNNVDENQPAGKLVGTLSTTDSDVGDTHTYTISGNDATSFVMDGNDLKTAAIFDFETKASYLITIRTTDLQGAFFDKAFTITVNDINESPTDITISNNKVDEKLPAGTPVGILTTTDQDAGDTQVYTFVAGSDEAAFTITNNTLNTATTFNYLTKATYNITIRTTDRQGAYFDKAFVINVNRVNLPPTDISLSSTSINENEPVGETIGTLSTVDANIDDNHTYSIQGGDGASVFKIDGSSLVASVSFDYETKNSYELTIRTTDSQGAFFDKNFTITVLDVNDSPTDIALSSSNVNEHLPIGTLIGTFTCMDQDPGDHHTYTLTDTDGDFFTITGDSLMTNAVFDYKEHSSYNIIVRATDSQNGFADKLFVIKVNNINEPPVITNALNNPVDTLKFTAFDTENLSMCLNVTDPDNDAVAISNISPLNETHGWVTVSGNDKTCMDYMPNGGFVGEVKYSVQVCDNGSPSLCDLVILDIEVKPKFIFSEAISPNGDGINDTWTIGGIERFPDNKIIIFSRWGDIVYKANGYNNVDVAWDGRYDNGKKTTSEKVPDGTYFYIIELTNGVKLSGFVVLKR